MEWLWSQDSKPGLFNGTTQVRKTLSSYSRVLCSLQCNSKSRGELEKVIVEFIKGLADETKCWVLTKGRSQTCQKNTVRSQVWFNKYRSRTTVLLQQPVPDCLDFAEVKHGSAASPECTCWDFSKGE